MVFFTQMFENVQVENIITTASDHFAVLLSLEKVAIKHEAFKYEVTWCRAVDYNDVVGKL
jgi:TATA-box binding protein (TBP) (component of TFIID and TFIIIB)